jgi:GNAT superfamily N-acetyltransferase
LHVVHAFNVKPDALLPEDPPEELLMRRAPLVRSVMTDPDHKGHRFARAVTDAALESLRAAGYPFVSLYITEGNTPSERLFASLGAEAATSD